VTAFTDQQAAELFTLMAQHIEQWSATQSESALTSERLSGESLRFILAAVGEANEQAEGVLRDGVQSEVVARFWSAVERRNYQAVQPAVVAASLDDFAEVKDNLAAKRAMGKSPVAWVRPRLLTSLEIARSAQNMPSNSSVEVQAEQRDPGDIPLYLNPQGEK